MHPMSRKTRIRCPLPYFVERPLVDSRSLLFDSLRGSSRAGATRTPNIAGTHLLLSQQSAELNETKGVSKGVVVDLNARQPKEAG
jgi:hypothetical protein